jgi:hypothetical protein
MTTTEGTLTHEEHERRMAEFRAKVRAEAMDMARQHNLCSVVEATLQKVGIDNDIRYITIVTTQETTQTLKVPEDLIFGLDDDALVKVAKQYVQGNLPNPRAWNTVEQITYVETPVGEPTVTLSEGTENTYQQRYASSEGRVMHLVGVLGSGRLENEAVCGARYTQSWNRWPDTSYRGEGRTCTKCVAKHAKLVAG